MKLIKEIEWKLRQLRYFYQKLRYGVSDQDCWNMDYTISKDIVKKLKYFRKFTEEKGAGYPCQLNSEEAWYREIDYMIFFWETMSWELNSDKQDERKSSFAFKRGYVSFNKYFHNLWD